jgi:hypothetical protein
MFHCPAAFKQPGGESPVWRVLPFGYLGTT